MGMLQTMSGAVREQRLHTLPTLGQWTSLPNTICSPSFTHSIVGCGSPVTIHSSITESSNSSIWSNGNVANCGGTVMIKKTKTQKQWWIFGQDTLSRRCFLYRSPRDDVTSHLHTVDNKLQKVTYFRLHHHQIGPKYNLFRTSLTRVDRPEYLPKGFLNMLR